MTEDELLRRHPDEAARADGQRSDRAFEIFARSTTLGAALRVVIKSIKGADVVALDPARAAADSFRLADIFAQEEARQADPAYRSGFGEGPLSGAEGAARGASYTAVLVRNDGDDEPGGEVRGDSKPTQEAAMDQLVATWGSAPADTYLSARIEIKATLDVDLGSREPSAPLRPSRKRRTRRSR